VLKILVALEFNYAIIPFSGDLNSVEMIVEFGAGAKVGTHYHLQYDFGNKVSQLQECLFS